MGVYRPATAIFYLKNQNNASPPDLTVAYGLANDLPVVGDWNDDGLHAAVPHALVGHAQRRDSHTDAVSFEAGLSYLFPSRGSTGRPRKRSSRR